MTWFLVLPFFLLWLVMAAGATAAARFVPQLHHLFPYVWRISLWATIGWVAASAALFGLLHLMDGAGPLFEAGSVGEQLFHVTVALAMFAGPFLACAVGWSLGVLLGIVLAYLKGRGAS